MCVDCEGCPSYVEGCQLCDLSAPAPDIPQSQMKEARERIEERAREKYAPKSSGPTRQDLERLYQRLVDQGLRDLNRPIIDIERIRPGMILAGPDRGKVKVVEVTHPAGLRPVWYWSADADLYRWAEENLQIDTSLPGS